MSWRASLTLPLVLWFGATDARSDGTNDEILCDPPTDLLEPERLLRAWSLDARGTVPTLAEYARLQAGERPEDLLQEWLQGEEFVTRAVRQHRELLWNNLGNLELMGGGTRLRSRDNSPLYRPDAAGTYRGHGGPCQEIPAIFDAQGRPLLMPFGDGTLREGYVEVEPYWAPGTTVEVCAFDAQEAAVSPTGTRCDTPDGIGDPACGCGPGLTWCMDSSTEDRIVHGFEAEVEQRIAAVVREDRPWTDLFLDSRAYVNGPTAWYWHHLSEFNSNARLSPSAWPIERIPDMPFGAEDDWRPVILGEQHAGVLTSPAFLLRFQTRRSRANRYYTSFICSPFTPPEQGIPPTIEGVRYAMDLQVRDGCDYCHAILEPVAAAWGRWPEVGAAYLDPEQYPAYREDCRACVGQDEANCPRACRQDYVIRAQGEEELPYLGMLRSYEFRRGEHEIYVEDGPRRLVADDLAAGRLQRCATEHLFLWYLGRETGVDEWNWARQATSDFMESGYSYRALAGAILQSDAYRRAR